MRFPTPLLVFGVVAAAAGCSSSTGLVAASIHNDTSYVTLGALDSTPVQVPSAFAVDPGHAVRTDLTAAFDFAYNVDTVGDLTGNRHVLLLHGVLGLDPNSTIKPGFIRGSVPFDSILRAPLNGYITDSVFHIRVGDRFIIRSRPTCSSLGQSEYGKMEIVAFDSVFLHSVTFKVLVNNNCGYFALTVGLPSN
jgi:hypothetical protein